MGILGYVLERLRPRAVEIGRDEEESCRGGGGGLRQRSRRQTRATGRGVEHLVLIFSLPTVPEMLDVLERVATEVRPAIRG